MNRSYHLSFARNLETDIPDCEPILHALFDSVSRGGDMPISVAEISALAMKYARAAGPISGKTERPIASPR